MTDSDDGVEAESIADRIGDSVDDAIDAADETIEDVASAADDGRAQIEAAIGDANLPELLDGAMDEFQSTMEDVEWDLVPTSNGIGVQITNGIEDTATFKTEFEDVFMDFDVQVTFDVDFDVDGTLGVELVKPN